MSEYRGFYAVCGVAVVGLLTAVAVNMGREDQPGPDPVPSATTMRTAPQGAPRTFLECRETPERPCVEVGTVESYLVFADGTGIPADVLNVDRSVTPAVVTIR